MIRASGVLAALPLLLLALSAVVCAQEPKEGDFPKWNTWKVAAKGDWVEYTLSLGPKVRFEVLEEPKNGKVKYSRKMFDADGKETGTAEQELAWNQIRLQATPSPRAEVTWRDDTTELCGHKLKCRVASWRVDKIVDEIWYCVDVPCGGVVKQTSSGADTVVLTGVNSKKLSGTGAAPKQTVNLPKFLAKVGNSAIYKITGAAGTQWQKREVAAIQGENVTLEQTPCDAEGVVAADAKVSTLQVNGTRWIEDQGEEKGRDIKLTVPAGEYVCTMHVKEGTNMTTTAWVSDGVLIKLHVKRDQGGKTVETTMELAKLSLK
ncbi:MAG: hypothetical protein HS108_14005 [Planctomycetes bacterium]|jgi:hypothetical protein|nr:hypothetical protein [Planctomycetota bacterium]MCL4731127.1 hypothetical protein [Planctomycetota bacterium]